MESSYLKTFIEVVRTGSFTKAAETLCVTQSAISRRIRYMEDQYECSLLDRSGPLLKQTEKGQLLLEKALKIMEIEQELELGLHSPVSNNSLSFVSTPTFGTAYLPHILSKFARTQPKATSLSFFLEMPEAIRENLSRGLFEIAVIEHCHDFDLSEFETVALPDDELVFAAARNIKLSGDTPQIEEILAHPLLICSRGCCTRVIMERNLESRGFSMEDFNQVIESANLEMLIQSLMSGIGVAFIPSVVIDSMVESGQLKTYQVADFLHHRKRSLVAPINTMKCSLAKKFSNEIISYFSELQLMAERKFA